jgi:hypothetical protein
VMAQEGGKQGILTDKSKVHLKVYENRPARREKENEAAMIHYRHSFDTITAAVVKFLPLNFINHGQDSLRTVTMTV